MKTLRRRAYANAIGFTYKRFKNGSWSLTNGQFGISQPVKAEKEKFTGIATILFRNANNID